ncbi:MAG: hypothetical protein U9R15_20470 [Chloroflexota bacterium]|nr:hypothetical protein [Chloroflexota bacterium]
MFPFLQDHFAGTFERKTPFRIKPGPKPGVGSPTKLMGGTGQDLVDRIDEQLRQALKRGAICDLILVIDDLDCHDPDERQSLFVGAVEKTLCDFSGTEAIEVLVGFAAPEIESWLIADWANTFAKDVDFRGHHEAMRHWLATRKGVPFSQPESFSNLDIERDTCEKKFSEAIAESAREFGEIYYSKTTHTSRLLRKITSETVENVSKKCPLFREWYRACHKACKDKQL